MRIFVEEYGFALLSAVVVLSLILFVPKLIGKAQTLLNEEGEIAGEAVKTTTIYANSKEYLKAESVLLTNRLNDEVLLTDFSIVADQWKTYIKDMEQSEEFISPLDPEKYVLSATPWHYGADLDNAVHLGLDYAVASGAELLAPANGIIIASGDGCGVGFLGCACKGGGSHMTSGGGNQIYMITSVRDKDGISRVYVIAFFHLLDKTVIGNGPVKQGDRIALTGSSGNSTGPHCHIEVYYLGIGDFDDIESSYLRTSYSASFGCSWGENGLSHICENQEDIDNRTMEGRTCRIDARKVLPQKETDELEGWKLW